MDSELEERRMAVLAACGVTDTSRDGAFDRLVFTAAQAFAAPYAAVAFVAGGRLWCKARVGLQHSEYPSQGSFAAACVEVGSLLLVEDAAADTRFAAAPIVLHEGVRSCAAAPVMSDGLALGCVCVMARVPRAFPPRLQSLLQYLAAHASALLRRT